ncbi:Clp protease N-terminal domain-containing protein, partial [Escherichia sp. HC-CC]
MLNQELELSLNMAFARAREHRHEFMTVEHLLLALLSNPSAREALEACSVDLVALRQELEAFIEQTTPVLPASEEERDTQPTLSFQRVLQRAVFHVQSSGRNEVTGANVLVAIFSEQESQAAYLLRKHEVSRHFRHIALNNSPGKTFRNRGFTDTRFPHQQRVVFTATAENLNSTLQLLLTTNQWVDSAHARKLIQVRREILHTFLPTSLFFAVWLAASEEERDTQPTLSFQRVLQRAVFHV